MKHRSYFRIFVPALVAAAFVSAELQSHLSVAKAAEQRAHTTAASPCAPLPNGPIVSIVAKHSGKVLEPVLGLQGNGVPVVQSHPVIGSNRQRFRLDQLPDGYCRIFAVSSNKVLTVAGASTGPAAALVQETWNDRDHQHFRFEEVEPGFFKIAVKKGGNVLDVTGAFMDNGTAIILFPGHEGSNQRFQLRA